MTENKVVYQGKIGLSEIERVGREVRKYSRQKYPVSVIMFENGDLTIGGFIVGKMEKV